MGKTAVLVRRCKTEAGWRRYPVLFGRNGRVRPGWVMVAGQEVLVGRGTYEVRTFEGRKAVYTPAGDAATEALALRDKMERHAIRLAAATAAGIVVGSDPRRASWAEDADAHVADARLRGAMVAADMSRRILAEFAAMTAVKDVASVSRSMILGWHQGLREKGNAERTIFLKHARLRTFLRFAKVPLEVMPPAPRYERTLPTVYEQEETARLFAGCRPRQRLLFSIALQCGLREQELMYLEWSDVHARDRTLRVQGKPEYGFKVKDSEQRDVPVPSSLLDELKANRDPKRRLLFGTAGDKPDGHMLRSLKRIANRQDLGCGRCDNCRREYPECDEWTLHKFRRTYITKLLRSGFDLRTVQAYAGHSDISSTMRYLRPAAATESQEKLNSITW